MDSSSAYVVLAGLYLVGVIVGLIAGCHIGEWLGKKLGNPVPAMLAGAAAGGTLGCLAMYALTRWVLSWLL